MSRRKALIIGVLAAAVLVGVYFFSNPQGSEATPSAASPATAPAGQESAPSATAQATEARLSGGQAGRAGGQVPLLASATLPELAARLAGPDYSPGEELYFRTQMALLCSEPPGGLSPPIATETGQPSERDVSRATLRDFAKSFCVGYGGSWQDEVAGYDRLAGDDKVAEVYEFASVIHDAAGNANDAAMRQAAITHLESVMHGEDAGVEALIAAETLQGLAQTSTAVRDLAEKSGWGLPTRDLASAQTLAQQMAMCEKYGGCGPNQALTMRQCSVNSVCRPGMTTRDVWRRTYSPKVIEAAESIRKQL